MLSYFKLIRMFGPDYIMLIFFFFEAAHFSPVVADGGHYIIFLVTPSVTWVVLMNWPIMGNIQELLVNSRRMITPRLFWL